MAEKTPDETEEGPTLVRARPTIIRQKPERRAWSHEECFEFVKARERTVSWLPFQGHNEYEDGHPREVHSFRHENDGQGGVQRVFTYTGKDGSGIPDTLGKRIRYVRERYQIRQSELGLMMGGAAQSTVGAWEKGDLYPKKELMVWFCELFGVAPGWLWLGARAKELEQTKLMEMIESDDRDHNTVAKIIAIVSMMQGDRKEGEEVVETREGFNVQKDPPGMVQINELPGNLPKGFPKDQQAYFEDTRSQKGAGSTTVEPEGVAGTGTVGLPSLMRDIPLLATEVKYVSILGTAAAAGADGPAMQFDARKDKVGYKSVNRGPGVASDEKDLYAVEITGDSMFPKHKDRDILIVSIRRQPRPGDTVIVQVYENPDDPEKSELLAYVKVLESQNQDTIKLKQYQPETSIIEIPRKNVKWIDRVMPEQELLFG